MQQRRIVLTGGPGAGKTTLLEMAKGQLCRHVVILPEAASLHYGSGTPRPATLAMRVETQRAIFRIQRESESAAPQADAKLVLCDRGILDGSAFWPGDEAEFWSALGTTREAELERYWAVIHLRPASLDHGYDHSNPVRVESPEQALAVDRRIENAWRGHPRRFFVESTGDFLEKFSRAMDLIRAELGECCAKS